MQKYAFLCLNFTFFKKIYIFTIRIKNITYF